MRSYLKCLLLACALVQAACISAENETSAPEPLPLPEGILRDPFWPVGYVPPHVYAKYDAQAPGKPENTPEDDAARQRALANLKISAIVHKNRQYFALINGNLVQSGDIIAMPYEGRVFRFRIRAVDARKAHIEPVD